MAEGKSPHACGIKARNELDMEKVRLMNYIPKSADAWCDQYHYPSTNSSGQPIPLTGDTIDEMLIRPIYGKTPSVNKQSIKKCVILADALYLSEFLDTFLIKCQSGTFLNIFPHCYTVNCNDPLVRQTSVGFVEVINLSKNALTIYGLLADEELFYHLLTIQPDIISINIGISDIKMENLAWQRNQISGEYIKRFQELIIHLQTYFLAAGNRGAFAENLIYSFNLLPIYVAADAIDHSKQTVFNAIQHTNLWGTTYYNITREEYKYISDNVNKKLHNLGNVMFDKFQLILLNPTPKWKFEGLHVDRKSGLPHSDMHREMLSNFCYCLARLVCNRRICTLGINSSWKSRVVERQLVGGCSRIYQNAEMSPKDGGKLNTLAEALDVVVVPAHESLEKIFSSLKM